MKSSTQKLLSFAFLAFTLGVVLYIGFTGNEVADLWVALKELSPIFLVYCFLCWLGYLLMDSLSVYYFLRKQNQRITLRQSLYVGMTGIYYCNVTPGASGGQPLQIYRLKQMGVPIGISGSALTVKFFCFQFILLVAGGVMWLLHPDFVARQTAGTQWVIWLGYIVNFFSIGLVLTMAVSKRAVRTIITLCIRLGVKLRICKDPERSAARWEAHCASFLSSVEMIRNRPKELLVQFGIALLQIFAQSCVVVAVYHAFGLSGTSFSELITMAILLYISASYTPLPGASGAQEGFFAVFFAGIFPDARLFVALLIWRFSTYYLSVLVGVVMVVCENMRGFSRKSAPNV